MVKNVRIWPKRGVFCRLSTIAPKVPKKTSLFFKLFVDSSLAWGLYTPTTRAARRWRQHRMLLLNHNRDWHLVLFLLVKSPAFLRGASDRRCKLVCICSLKIEYERKRNVVGGFPAEHVISLLIAMFNETTGGHVFRECY